MHRPEDTAAHEALTKVVNEHFNGNYEHAVLELGKIGQLAVAAWRFEEVEVYFRGTLQQPLTKQWHDRFIAELPEFDGYVSQEGTAVDFIEHVLATSASSVNAEASPSSEKEPRDERTDWSRRSRPGGRGRRALRRRPHPGTAGTGPARPGESPWSTSASAGSPSTSPSAAWRRCCSGPRI